MELRDFVAETLKQIIDGVKLAQEHAKDAGAAINPPSPAHRAPQFIEFDVAVTTTEGDQIKGGAGVFVGPVGLGTQAQSEATSSAVNRIKFSIPLLLPCQRTR